MSQAKQITHDFDGRLQKIFQEFFFNWFFSSKMSDQDIVDTYIADDFHAIIDGVELNRDDFAQRVSLMRRSAVIERQEFVQMMEQGDRLFSMHVVNGQSLKTDSAFKTRAIALFVFDGDRIKDAYLNSATEGDPRDADIAFRH
ncbi:MAG: nuclear transport factor 2 family protein [Pseudomonadota bacterium]